MKRDMELMRKILFKIEEEYKPGQGIISDIKIDGYDTSTIAEHCDLLYQQGFIKHYSATASIATDEMEIDIFDIGNITNTGYDYLELIRNNDIWEKTKTEIEEKKLPNTMEQIAKVAGIFIGNVFKEFTDR